MVGSIQRRKRKISACSSAAICWLMLMTRLRMTAARTWETVVDSSAYILLDESMIEETKETDPVFTRTDMDTGNSTAPEPGRLDIPTMSPSTASPATSPKPTPIPAASGPLVPTTSPTEYYQNPGPVCADGEVLHDVLLYDVWGDGWNGRNLTFTMKAGPHVITKATNVTEGNITTVVYKTTVVNESDYGQNSLFPGTRIFDKTFPPGLVSGYDYVCIRPGCCYEATMPGGLWSEEIGWEIRQTQYAVNPLDNNGLIIARGGAPSSCDFSIPNDSPDAAGYTLCPTTCTRLPGDPSSTPTAAPTGSREPSSSPTQRPTTLSPTPPPSQMPTPWPTQLPTPPPTQYPTEMGWPTPTQYPTTQYPTDSGLGWTNPAPTQNPSDSGLGWTNPAPTQTPSGITSPAPSSGLGWTNPAPTQTPSGIASPAPSSGPTSTYSESPSTTLTEAPSSVPPIAPTQSPGNAPSTVLSPSAATSSPGVLAPAINLPTVAVPATPPPSPYPVASSGDIYTRPLTEPPTVETLNLPNFGGFRRKAGETTGDAGDESAVSSVGSSGKKRQ